MNETDQGAITLHRGSNIQLLRESGDIPVPPVHDKWRNFTSYLRVTALYLAEAAHTIWLIHGGGLTAVNTDQGYSVRRYGAEHGLPGNAIAAVCSDHEGRVWAAGAEGGLAWLGKEGWMPYGRMLMDARLRDQPVRALCHGGKAGGIYAATVGCIFRIPAPGAAAERLCSLPAVAARDVVALAADDDSLYVGTAWGLYRIAGNTKPERVGSDVMSSCVALAFSPNGDLWAASYDTLYRIADTHAQKVHALGVPVRGLAAGRSRIWVLAASGSIGVWQNRRWIELNGVDATAVQALAPSGNDRFLFIGGSQGLGFIDTPAPFEGSAADVDGRLEWLPLPPSPLDLPAATCRCIAGPDDRGRVFVGTVGGAVLFDGDRFESTLSVDIRDVERDGRGQTWLLCYPNGLLRFDEARDQFERVDACPGLPTALSVDNNGYPCCLTGQGIFRREKSGWAQIVAAEPAGFPTAFMQDAEGIWWLGTLHGLFFFRPAQGAQSGSFVHTGDEHSGLVSIHALLRAYGSLWAGADSGLWCHTEASWQQHNITDPVQALARGNDGQLWLVTTTEILRYDPATHQIDANKRWPIAGSGLGSRRVVGLVETSGYLWFATAAGVSRLTIEATG